MKHLPDDNSLNYYKDLDKYDKESGYLNVIKTVAKCVHKSLNLEEILENAVDVMNKHIMTAQNVSIYMVEGDNAVLKAYRGYPKEKMKTLTEIPYPKGFTWKVINECIPLHCPDVDLDPHIGQKGKDLGTMSYVSMPIRYMDKTLTSRFKSNFLR